MEEGAGAGQLLKVLDLASTAGCPEVEGRLYDTTPSATIALTRRVDGGLGQPEVRLREEQLALEEVLQLQRGVLHHGGHGHAPRPVLVALGRAPHARHPRAAAVEREGGAGEGVVHQAADVDRAVARPHRAHLQPPATR